jgi:DNA (cytosine-5)-methyltransferase 1
MASSQILIRAVPEDVQGWINAECERQRVSQQDLLLSLLREVANPTSQLPLFAAEPEPASHFKASTLPFTFIDLFAGVGGLRLALEAAGGRCMFSSEWDRHCQRTYQKWFGECPEGDITKEEVQRKIPKHFDLLAAGFPCQPFSIAGVSKKNSLGRAHGFKDATQGNLFFTLANIIERHRPPAFLLENVKNLRSHDQGRTWDVIYSRLDGMKYKIFHQVIDAAWWVPQHRERIFIVGFDKKIFGENPPFSFPTKPEGASPRFASILETTPDSKYTLSDHLWVYLKEYADRHREKGNGFGYGMAPMNGVTRTLSARYFKDGSEILVEQKKGNPRRLTPRECARLMGFPDRFGIVVSDTQAYKQFGNAVVPPAAEAVGRQIVEVFAWHMLHENGGAIVRRNRASSRVPAREHALRGG